VQALVGVAPRVKGKLVGAKVVSAHLCCLEHAMKNSIPGAGRSNERQDGEQPKQTSVQEEIWK